MLTIEHIRERVEEISNIGNVLEDYETAHIREDELLYDFVNYIAKHMDCDRVELIEMAEEIMRVNEMRFTRWYS